LEKSELVIFGEEVILNLNGGTKRFDINCVEAAFEFKYIKNLKYLRPGGWLFDRFEKDINRLNHLPNGIKTNFLLFSNFNLLRKEMGKTAWKELSNRYDCVTCRYTHPLME